MNYLIIAKRGKLVKTIGPVDTNSQLAIQFGYALLDQIQHGKIAIMRSRSLKNFQLYMKFSRSKHIHKRKKTYI